MGETLQPKYGMNLRVQNIPKRFGKFLLRQFRHIQHEPQLYESNHFVPEHFTAIQSGYGCDGGGYPIPRTKHIEPGVLPKADSVVPDIRGRDLPPFDSEGTYIRVEDF